MKIALKLLMISTLLLTTQAYADHVSCLISGTPTQQQLTPDFCSSTVNVSQPGVLFQFVGSKPVAEVQWSYSSEPNQQWNCSTGSQCYVNFRRFQQGGLNEVTACVTRVLYRDNTWENVNHCATGMFSGYGGPGDF